MIAALVGEGRTVVLSSHLLDEVEKTATRSRSSTTAASSSRA
jgi:ABC-type multidrug transport system ATPase subunit